MNRAGHREDRKCHTCDKIFSKKEHLTRHIRGHKKERPFGCPICGKLYSRSDVLRRHERSQHEKGHSLDELINLSPQEFSGDSAFPTPPSAADASTASSGVHSGSDGCAPPQIPATIDDIASLSHDDNYNFGPVHISTQDPGHERMVFPGTQSWLLQDDFDVSALDFSITSTISEWAQIPHSIPASDSRSEEAFGPIAFQSPVAEVGVPNTTANTLKRKWFTHISPSEESRANRELAAADAGRPDETNANESYRAGLSQKLRRPMEDEALPSSEQLNLFAKLYFHRFHPLLPIIHTPSFRPTAENSLLFLSICSIGSLFVGSPRAVNQGSRIFERLNKAILASWESFLSQSRPDALSMVQAGILGQTYAILSGKPKFLVLADVLHGTVAAWAREADRLGALGNQPHDILDSANIEGSWHRYIDSEQRARVQVALNIHDAELAAMFHHQPIRSHRPRQFPHLESEKLFAAPMASKWAILFRQTMSSQSENAFHTQISRPLDSGFAAYGILEGINARLIDAKQSGEFDDLVSLDISTHLIQWWQMYRPTDHDPFSLPVLWHCTFITLYADMKLLEQAVGRDGDIPAREASDRVREWAQSVNASRCLVHASLIARYLERMSISAEPAIHIPRALFSAALVYLCGAKYEPKKVVDIVAFASPEIELLGDGATQTACFPEHARSGEGSIIVDLDQVYRMIDLLQRGSRWGISQAFASVLCSALEEGKGGV